MTAALATAVLASGCASMQAETKRHHVSSLFPCPYPGSKQVPPAPEELDEIRGPVRLEIAFIARGEPNCQSIAGPPIDEAIGTLVAERITPAAVELALEIRREIEAQYEEADQLRCRAVERAQIEADLAAVAISLNTRPRKNSQLAYASRGIQ